MVQAFSPLLYIGKIPVDSPEAEMEWAFSP
jgi:hypothetical protein